MKLMTDRRTALVALPFLLCTFFIGCGRGGIPPLISTPPVTTGTGNWSITGYYEDTPNTFAPYYIEGSLINTNGQITGVFHIGTNCFGFSATDIPYTGTLDSKNNLSITSSSVNGQILTVQGLISSDGSTLSRANFAVTGGCSRSIVGITRSDGPGAEETTTGVRIPSLSGTWTSAISTTGPATVISSELLTQSSAPDVHGDYALTGTVTAQGSSCFSRGTLQSGSFVSGNAGRERILMEDGSTLNATLQVNYGSASQAKPTLYLPGTITGGNCNGPIQIDLQ